MDRDDRLLAYLQNRLTAPERQSFEREVETDPALAAEVSVMRAVRAEMGQAHAPRDTTQGWTRLQAALDRDEGRASKPANDNSRPIWAFAQVAAVAVAAVMVWQLAVVPMVGPAPDEFYRTASQNPDLPALQVAFSDGAALGEVTRVLRTHGGTIIDGPGALGIYRIAFPDEASRSAAEAELASLPGLAETVIAE